MNMRRSAMAALLLLAGCGDPNEATREAIAKRKRKRRRRRIECATAGAASFARACTVERLKGPEGTMLIVHHADGGFRRLLVATDGRGVVAADGAEEAAVSVIAGDRIEVALGGDRYRLPATVKGPS
jgi:hypothetical protein